MWANKVSEHKQKIDAAALELFKEKEACRCCWEHQTKRPKYFWCYKEFPCTGSLKILKECRCDCRHVMRHITAILD